MKNFLTPVLALAIAQVSGQSLNFDNVNSTNVLNVLNMRNNEYAIQASKTSVVQIGHFNNATVFDKSKRGDILIRQTGDLNNTLLVNTRDDIENQQKVKIEGNNNYIDITGNNSNSRQMEINVKGDDKMIFIRHY